MTESERKKRKLLHNKHSKRRWGARIREMHAAGLKMDGKYREDTEMETRDEKGRSSRISDFFLQHSLFCSTQSAETGIGFRRQGCQAVTFDGCGKAGKADNCQTGRQAGILRSKRRSRNVSSFRKLLPPKVD